MTRSAAREQFYRDILTTLAEQGLVFGVGEAMATEQTPELDYISVTVRYPEANAAGFVGRRMTTDDMDAAFRLLWATFTEDQAGALQALDVTQQWRNKMLLAQRENDGGKVEPTDAADLAELAFFGKVYF